MQSHGRWHVDVEAVACEGERDASGDQPSGFTTIAS